MNNKNNLVIGGAGFLGNNTIRELLKQGEQVKTSVRKNNLKKPFEGLDCEIVEADLLDKESLVKAMKDVDIVYNCAAIYKSWAKNPQEEIIAPNVKGIKNLLIACNEARISRLVYVSSGMVLAGHAPLNENSSWNEDSIDPYVCSKIQSEKLAWKMAKEYNIDMISILPSAMIGPHSYGHLPPSMEFYYNVMKNKIPFDPCFYFNVVDVRDVVKGMVIAGQKAPSHQRYILGPENNITTTEIFELANKLFPEVQIKPKRSKGFLMTVAFFMEMISKLTGKKPLLQRSFIKQFSDKEYRFDISKAKRELGFNPKPSMEAIEDLLRLIKKETSNAENKVF